VRMAFQMHVAWARARACVCACVCACVLRVVLVNGRGEVGLKGRRKVKGNEKGRTPCTKPARSDSPNLGARVHVGPQLIRTHPEL
jgi:hypothetical protein